MNREIKFRAWDNKDNSWLLGYEYPNLGGFSMFGENMLFNEWSNILNRFILHGKDRKPDDLILMQYTGLKDKDGKEIYEGDIIDVVNKGVYNSLRVITWDDTLLCYVAVWASEWNNWIGSQGGITYLKVSSGLKSKKVGNIYETPELLHP